MQGLCPQLHWQPCSPATLHLPGHPLWTEEGFWLLSKPPDGSLALDPICPAWFPVL